MGNLKRKKDPRDTVWNYEYFSNNLLEKLSLTGADNLTYEARYEYDQAGNRKQVIAFGNTIRYNYDNDVGYHPDPMNRINSVDRSFDGAGYRTEYRYDPAGLLTGLKYPEAETWLDYQYNNLNQLEEVVGFTVPRGIAYETDGAVESLSLLNNITTVYTYDSNQRLLNWRPTREPSAPVLYPADFRQAENELGKTPGIPPNPEPELPKDGPSTPERICLSEVSYDTLSSEEFEELIGYIESVMHNSLDNNPSLSDGLKDIIESFKDKLTEVLSGDLHGFRIETFGIGIIEVGKLVMSNKVLCHAI